jgi:hypothetical protein
MGAFFKDQGLIGLFLAALEAVSASKLISKGLFSDRLGSPAW